MRIILYPVATEAAWPLDEFQFIHLMRSGAANCILIAFRVGRVRVSSRNGAHGIRKSSTLRLKLQCVGICRNLLQTGRANSKKFLSSSLAHCPASSAVLNTKQSRENRSLRPLSLSSTTRQAYIFLGYTWAASGCSAVQFAYTLKCVYTMQPVVQPAVQPVGRNVLNIHSITQTQPHSRLAVTQ